MTLFIDGWIMQEKFNTCLFHIASKAYTVYESRSDTTNIYKYKYLDSNSGMDMCRICIWNESFG